MQLGDLTITIHLLPFTAAIAPIQSRRATVSDTALPVVRSDEPDVVIRVGTRYSDTGYDRTKRDCSALSATMTAALCLSVGRARLAIKASLRTSFL